MGFFYFFYMYLPVTFKCTQEFVLMTFYSYSALTNSFSLTLYIFNLTFVSSKASRISKVFLERKNLSIKSAFALLFNNQQKLLLSFRSLPEVLFPKWDRGYMRAVSAQSRSVQADFVLCHGALPPLPPGSQAHLCTATRYSDVQAPTPLFPSTFVFVLSQLLFRKCVYKRV